MDRSGEGVDGRSLPKRGTRAELIGLMLNVIAIVLSLRFVLYAPKTALFLPFDGLVLLGLGACGVLIVLPLACMAMLAKETGVRGLLGVVLALTPIPLYVSIFVLIDRAKDFVFW